MGEDVDEVLPEEYGFSGGVSTLILVRGPQSALIAVLFPTGSFSERFPARMASLAIILEGRFYREFPER